MMRKSVKISKLRNKRVVPIAANHVVLSTTNKAVVGIICHRHFSGWTIIGLNTESQPVRIWSTLEGIEPFRAIPVTADKIRDLVLRQKSLKNIYANDVSVLSPFSSFKHAALSTYTDTLNELMERLERETIERTASRTAANAVPTFAEIRRLDSSITYRDYAMIYGRS